MTTTLAKACLLKSKDMNQNPSKIHLQYLFFDRLCMDLRRESLSSN